MVSRARAVLKDGRIVVSAYDYGTRAPCDSAADEHATLNDDLYDSSFLTGEAYPLDHDGSIKRAHDELREQIDWEASQLLWEMTDYG